MHSISAVLAQALVSGVGLAYLDFTPSRPAFAGAIANLSDGAEKIPLDQLNEFFLQVQRRSGGEDIGLLAYQKAHPGNLGVLGFAIMSSSTIHSALQCIIDFYPTIGTGFCLYLEEQRAQLRFVGTSADASGPPLPRVFIDAIASITLGLLHWLTPTVRIMPTLAEFTYPCPEDTRPLQQMFGPNLVFSSAVNALTFLRCDTDQPIPTFDAALQQMHLEYLKRKTRELATDSVSTRVKRIVLQHLHQTKPLTVDEVARALNLSTHQLTRALEMSGDCFQKLLDQTRRQQTHHLLVNTEQPLKQISYSVGFKSQSALNKACERWFGMSPGRYRFAKASSIESANG